MLTKSLPNGIASIRQFEHSAYCLWRVGLLGSTGLAPCVAFLLIGGEGGIQLARFASSLLTCRSAAASVEQGSKAHTALGRKTKWAPQGDPFHFLAERQVACGGCSGGVAYLRRQTDAVYSDYVKPRMRIVTII